ncbi:hypothetical protein SAMN05216184_101583 [Georgenia satyanarayanai]|uniref:SatD family (SatD) n=1 Tax=Georgenia satyanarayanai TaxID=860221 RepID=A0A2Y8ZY46_9MICO|nr:hypothetical protein [Georgenia satyanarayanai]PYG02114.1 hypothetical protein A8987_101583 [Georgenia satyanarayanai]SSA36925.1 hypothetical protein SAMN05216184_101583 [Georgenia satyanarayanai]
MFVMTADQKASRSRGDAVPGLLHAVSEWCGRQSADPFVLPLERTVGDEVQGVLADPHAVVGLVLLLQRLGGWSVGVGAGPVVEPLAESAPASAGEAFILARAAVERARGRSVSVPLAVDGVATGAAEEAEALLQLLAAVVRRRSDAGWEVVDLLAEGGTQRAAAERLGISAQAVSQRLDAALWQEEVRLHPLAARLLTAAEGVAA